jgi:hypothetical protein
MILFSSKLKRNLIIAQNLTQFTIEIEENNQLPFLNVMLNKKGDGKLEY